MMGNGIHFRLDQLPERYRAQVVTSVYGTRRCAGEMKCGNETSKVAQKGDKMPHKGLAHMRGKKSTGPIRMRQNKADGPNKTEAQFNRDILFGEGKYEPLTLLLPSGVKYTPDWLFADDGEVYLVEVKGSYHLPTMGRSVMAFKIACEQFPMFSFVFAELGKDGRTWNVGVYKGGALIKSVRGTAKELMGEDFQ